MAAAVLHDMVLNCDIQGLKATIKDLQKEGIDVKDEVTSHEFGRRGARILVPTEDFAVELGGLSEVFGAFEPGKDKV
eukprot:s198_g10.t1